MNMNREIIVGYDKNINLLVTWDYKSTYRVYNVLEPELKTFYEKDFDTIDDFTYFTDDLLHASDIAKDYLEEIYNDMAA